MCSIIGYLGEKLSLETLREEFSKTIKRGPDATKFITDEQVIFGFNRLSIMGLDERGMQPFFLNGNIVVCNGEIYGFRTLKRELEKEYTFTSESDCEIILPLYEKYGVEMFKKLDSEFAMIIYDRKQNKIIAARDPIGIRPLYYGYNENKEIVFASEPIALINICDKVYPFPPGHYYQDGKFIEYIDIAKVSEYRDDSLEVITKNIHDLLVAGVEKRLDADAPLGFLLSGGLDSSLVCSIAARKLEKPIRTFAIGMKTDAIDLKYAKEVSTYLGTIHTEVIITKEQVLDALEEVIKILGTFDITTIRASIGMYLLCKEIHETTDIKVLMTGEISDELFGYKYTDFAPNAIAFQEEAAKRIRELHMYDVLRADRCISSNSLEARVPFGDLKFVQYVMSINPTKKINTYGQGKYLLRKAFTDGYLPNDILYREKAAFSDAVGHSLVYYLKEYSETKYTEEEFKKKSKQFKHATPFTKESLLYREIFEKYYCHQDQMIVDFWMPNKSWEGCNVNDPSARVLSNYGNSGK